MDEVRINRYLARKGICSRRQADALIREGRVLINEVVAELGTPVRAGDRVCVDGKEVPETVRPIYIKFHKPLGITTTTALDDPDNIITFINHPARLFPVGRLDKFSSGLILLTNDGDIGDRLLRPAHGHEKEYLVRVAEPFDAAFLDQMRQGVVLDGRRTLPCRIRQTGERSFSIVIVEGRNRQIRRMCEVLGNRAVNLKRVRIMHIELGDLRPGQWVELSPAELQGLRRGLSLNRVRR